MAALVGYLPDISECLDLTNEKNKSAENYTTKKCTKCLLHKKLDEFNKNNADKHGRRPECKTCQRESKLIYRRGLKMKKTRFSQIYEGLSSVAKKAYEGTPIQEPWEIARIVEEVMRVTPSFRDARVIKGCLNTLVQSGLVKEVQSGKFQRVRVDIEENNMKKHIQQGVDCSSVVNKPNNKSPIDKIAGLQSFAEKILNDVKALIDEIDTVAIDVEEQFSNQESESKKLKQLQELLKSL